MARDSIFEFGDRFGGVESPFGNWMKEVVEKTKPPKLVAAFYSALTEGDTVEIYIAIHAENLKSTEFHLELQESDLAFNDAVQKIKVNDTRKEFLVKLKVPRKRIDAEVNFFEGLPEFVVVVTCDGKSATTGEFVIPDEVKGSVAYYVYADGTIEKNLPKGYDETRAKHIDYYYVDKNKVEHFIATAAASMVQKRKNGIKDLPSILNGYTSKHEYPKGGNAQVGYSYPNGDIVVKGTQFGIRKYPIDKGKIQLIRMPDELNYESDDFQITYRFQNSQRRYCNPMCFAGFIGALADINLSNIVCTGMCFGDATSYPSVSHPNGDSADTGYLSTLELEQKKVDAFKKFGFTRIYRGQGFKMVKNKQNQMEKVITIPWLPHLKNSEFMPQHEDHLHAGEFNLDRIKVVKK